MYANYFSPVNYCFVDVRHLASVLRKHLFDPHNLILWLSTPSGWTEVLGLGIYILYII